jgi:tetratricopeptide (TPR) repeat protein
MRSPILILSAVLAAALLSSGCEKLRARDHLNKGVAAFKGAKYADAAEHFKAAVELDPEFPTPRLYLATAYMQQYIPGAESPENMEMARKANEEFMTVLKADGSNKLAIESLASLRYNQAQGIAELDKKFVKLDEAAEWYQKLVDVDPQNKQGLYSLAVITWLKWYAEYKPSREKMGMKPEEAGPFKDKKIREELKAKWEPQLNKAIGNLEKALAVDAEYDDAMAYMNLLIRQKADLAETKEDAEKEVKTADSWVQKALDTKKLKAERLEKKAAGGIIQDGKEDAK